MCINAKDLVEIALTENLNILAGDTCIESRVEKLESAFRYHLVFGHTEPYHKGHRHSESQKNEFLFDNEEEAISYALLMAHFGHYPWLWTIQYCVGYEFNFATKQFVNVCY